MSDDIKKQLGAVIDSYKEDLCQMADKIFDLAEISGEEYKTSDILCSYLEKEGFVVECGTGLETAFRATWDNGSNGPVLGILVEYDALEKIGHACGHHLQGPAGIGAAIAVKNCLQDYPCRLVVYGTPAEETLGGKIIMLDKGYMKELDLALMSHGSPNTSVDEKCMALENFVVTFHGVKSHAAISPEEGRSALDAALLSFHAIEMLREHVKDDTRMHYTIRNAGGPPNVVPDLTVAEYTLRSYSTKYLDEVVERFYNILKGAALMTGTTYEVQRDLPFKSKVVCHKVNDLLMANAAYENAPSIAPPREKTGSTDFGNVLYEVPGSCIRIAFTDKDAQPHSEAYLKAGKSDAAHNAICMVKNEGKGWGKEAVAAFGSSALALISLYFVITNTMNDEYGGYVQAKPMFSYYLYIIACIIGAVVGIMIIKEHQKKLTANVGAVRQAEKPNVWVKTALYTVGETFAIYVLFFLISEIF